MIAKSDLFILTIASGLLIFTLMRSSILEPTVRTSAKARPVARVVEKNTEMTSLKVTNSQDKNQSQTQTPVIQAETIVVTESTSDTSSDFREPEVIHEAAFKTHVVKSGEYLGLIAKRYNTTIRELRELNNLKGSTIFIGQQLVYPEL